MNAQKILFTGGKGLLASTMKTHFPDAIYVDIEDFDVTNYPQMQSFISQKDINTIVHCAAYTLVSEAEKNVDKLLEVNVIGTANVVKLCMQNNIKMVYISTDYVFDGEKGMYKETDPVLPVNKYAWSKLAGECAVRLYDNSLIIRTTFSPKVFPYEAAFIDQWTSRESVEVIAEKIAKLIKKDAKGVFHVGGKRKTVYELAISLDPSRKIGKRSIKELDVILPRDTSLDTSKYDKFISE